MFNNFRSESVLSTASSKKSSRKKSNESIDGKLAKERKESNAARTIQRNWRKHRMGKLELEVFCRSMDFS